VEISKRWRKQTPSRNANTLFSFSYASDYKAK
jgi:hypothetical protein